ncbi:MAG: phytanoyl-CoA dioxygenase family protein [Myxococcota bacterium]
MSGPLHDLSDPHPLTREEVLAHGRDGHVIVRGLASPAEVSALRPALLEAGAACRHDSRPLAERDTYGKAFVQMFNLWRQNELARVFVFARRFARVAAELMGVSAVRLYHDQALFKEPGGGATPWHQDHFYWPLETPDTITLWMPLVQATPEMGLMTFASGSHTQGSLGDFAIGDASQAAFERLVESRGLPRAHTPALAPGDASFHSGWTLHCAPANRTRRLREAMTIIYYADGAQVGPLDHPARRLDRDVWLAGCEPGELAAGPLNPVLYDATRGD